MPPDDIVPSPVTAATAPRIDTAVAPAAEPAPAIGKPMPVATGKEQPKGGQQYYELEQPRPMPEPELAKKP